MAKKRIESAFFYKTVRGKRSRYVKVVLRGIGKTKVKQYKYRGGKSAIYEKEALLPKGSYYLVNYRKGEIIKNPKQIESLVKRIKGKRRISKGKPSKVTKNKVLKQYHLVPKRVRHPPKPIESEKIVKLLDGKIYYEREHSITEFPTRQEEDTFLLSILTKATKKREYAKSLLQNFSKIKLKMSYVVEIMGIDANGKQDLIGYFTAIGKRPTEIKKIVEEARLLPGETYIDIDSARVQQYKQTLIQNGVSTGNQQLNKGKYRVTDVKLMIKFYNNPQKQII